MGLLSSFLMPFPESESSAIYERHITERETKPWRPGREEGPDEELVRWMNYCALRNAEPAPPNTWKRRAADVMTNNSHAIADHVTDHVA